MKFLTGIDYPHVCSICRSAIDDAAIPYQSGEMPDTDNDEVAIDFVYDNNLYCGGHECVNKGGDAFDTPKRNMRFAAGLSETVTLAQWYRFTLATVTSATAA